MNPTIDHNTDEHEDIVLLLPWYVNQSLEPAEQARVKAHVRGCLECRRELQTLGQIEQTLQEPEDVLKLAARASYRDLQRRIATPAVRPADVAGLPAHARKRNSRLRALTSLALAASLLLLAAPLALHRFGGVEFLDYQTLANRGAPEQGQLRVVFAPDLPFVKMDQLLRSIGGEVVGGPNTAGAYTIRLSAAHADPRTTVDFLRRQPGVVLAEPVLQAATGEQP
jgi:hypothetical protein